MIKWSFYLLALSLLLGSIHATEVEKNNLTSQKVFTWIPPYDQKTRWDGDKSALLNCGASLCLNEKKDVVGVDFSYVPAAFPITDETFQKSVIPALAKFPQIEHLNFYRAQITDQVLPLLRNCPKVTFLSLYGTHITNKGLLVLSKDLPNLNGLVLSQCRVSEQGVVSANFQNLKELFLGGMIVPGTEKNLRGAYPDVKVCF